MDADRWGLALSTAGLATAFASQIPDSDGLLVLAYALVAAGAWLLVRERLRARVGVLAGAGLACLAFLVVARQRLVVGFRGERLAAVGVVLEAPVWDALLLMAPLVVLAGALLIRTSSWGRAGAALSLVLASITLAVSTGLVPFLAVGNHVVGGAFMFVLAPLLAALASLGAELRAVPEADFRNGAA